MKSISATVVCVASSSWWLVHPAPVRTSRPAPSPDSSAINRAACFPGATVTAVHEPTGTTYEGVTQGDGRFSLLNVRVGGPYQVAVTLGGFRSETVNASDRTLGESTEVACQAGAGRASPKSSRSPPSRFRCSPPRRPAPRTTLPQKCSKHCRRSIAASRTSRGSRRTSCSTRSTATPPRSQWPGATPATTTSRSTAR